jgi:two-component system, sensor histidine kinase
MSNFQFKQFKPFATYLLENKLDETVRWILEAFKKANLPLLTQLSYLSEEELFSLSRQGLKDFLQSALQDTALQVALTSLDEWKNNLSPLVSRNQVQLSDIVLVYNIRKRCLVQQLSAFTAEIHTALKIVEELDQFSAKIEQYAFQTYVDIQQEQLKQERDFVSSLIDHSVNGVLGFDKELRITYWNTILESWNRLEKADVLGRKVFELFPGYEHTDEGQAMFQVLKGKQVKIREKPFRARNGFYEIDIIPLISKQGEVTGGFSIIRDITEHKQIQKTGGITIY